MKLDASVVIPSLFFATYAAWGLLAAAAALTRRLHGRIERRYWRTLHTRTCRGPQCRGRVWERITRDYDADLGFVYDREETCPACRLDANNVIEIDFGSCSMDDIRSLDRDHTTNAGAM